MSVVDLLTNFGSATVVSGGTDAPVAGTVQTWTVANQTGIPAASNTASPPTQFRVVDATGLILELVGVTNVSGSTWTVTRGIEGTTPAAHAAGWTAEVSFSVGAYDATSVTPNVDMTAAGQLQAGTTTGTGSNARQLIQVVSEPLNMNDPKYGGVQGTTTDWTSVFAAAYVDAQASVNNGYGPCIMRLQSGLYAVGSTTPGSRGTPTTPASFIPGAVPLKVGYATSLARSIGVKGDSATSTVIQYPKTLMANVIQDASWGVLTGIPSYQPSVDGLTILCTDSVKSAGEQPLYSVAITGQGGSGSSAFSAKPVLHAGGLLGTSIAWVGVFNGVPVTPAAPGYFWLADQLVQYTGYTTGTVNGIATVTLTGAGTGSTGGAGGNCRVQSTNNGTPPPFDQDLGWGSTTATGPNLLHARAYPFDNIGHGIALSGSGAYVGRDVEILYPLGHCVALQGGGNHAPTASSWAGSDIEPRRMYGYQWDAIFWGPGTSDARGGGGSYHGYYGGSLQPNGNTDGGMYAGLKALEGDADIARIHIPGAPGQDIPSVMIQGADVKVHSLTKDTSTAEAYLWDGSGHWAQPSAIKNPALDVVTWESPGLPNPGPGPTVQGTTAPLILKTAAGTSTGATFAQQGMLRGVSMNSGHDVVLAEGPYTVLLGGSAVVNLAAPSSTYAPAGVLNAAAIYGFSPFGNFDGCGNFPVLAQLAVLNQGLTGGTGYAAVTVLPLTEAVPSGTTVTVSNGLTTDSFVTTGTAAIGATSLTPSSTFTPASTYIAGTGIGQPITYTSILRSCAVAVGAGSTGSTIAVASNGVTIASLTGTQPVTLTSTAGMATSGTLTLPALAGATIAYTGISGNVLQNCTGTGSGTLTTGMVANIAVGGTLTVTCGGLGATSALPSNWPSTGIAIINPSTAGTAGPVIVPFTGATVPVAVTGVANSTTCVVTAAGTWTAGQSVVIAGVLGATGANGTWTITTGGSGSFTITLGSAPGVYTSGGTATSNRITVAITAQNQGQAWGNGAFVTVHQFQGCSGGVLTTAADLTPVIQPMRNISGTKITGFEFSDTPLMGLGPITSTRVNAASQIALPPVSTLGVATGNHGAVSFTLGVSEWAKWSPNAGKTATLPLAPTPGQPIRLELLTAFAATVSGNGNTIYYQGASVGTSQTLPAGIGQVYEYTWDSVNSWWECILISSLPVSTVTPFTVVNHGALSFTVGNSEWAKWSPNAGKTATLPSSPVAGQPIRVEMMTAFAATVSGGANNIYFLGASLGTSQTIPAVIGALYEYTWDSVNSWWECALISELPLSGDVTTVGQAATVGKINGVAITAAQATLLSQLNNATTRSATATLLAGEETIFTGSTATQTLTLPGSTAQASTINTITNLASVTVSVAQGSGTTLNYNNVTTSPIVLAVGQSITFILIGAVWYATNNDMLPFTGSGSRVLATSPALVTPTLGAALATSINGLAISTSTGTLTVANGATLATTGAFTTTFAASATATMTLPGASATLAGLATTQTLTNKRITRRVTALSANSATPAINTDNFDVCHITAQTATITGFTMTGTPVDGDTLHVSITGTTAVPITWGASFEASGGTALPTTTVTTARLDVDFVYNTETSKWRCVRSS